MIAKSVIYCDDFVLACQGRGGSGNFWVVIVKNLLASTIIHGKDCGLEYHQS